MAKTLAPAQPDLDALLKWAGVEGSPLTHDGLMRAIRHYGQAAVRNPIVWGVPTRGEVRGVWVQAFHLMNRHPEDRVWCISGTLVHANRNKLCESFLQLTKDDPRFEWLLQWDDDVIFRETHVDNIARMIRTAKEHDVKLVSGVYVQKKRPNHPHIYTYVDKGDRITDEAEEFFGKLPEELRHEAYPLMPKVKASFYPVLDYVPGSAFEADGVGGGCLLIHKDVLWTMAERLRPEGWEPGQKTPEGLDVDPPQWFTFGLQLGEDLAFCHQARQAGFKIIVDTSIKLGHISDEVLTFDHYVANQLALKHKDEVQAQRQGVQDRMAQRANGTPTDDKMERLFEDGKRMLGDFLNKSSVYVEEMLQANVMEVIADEWTEADPQSAEEVRAFYEQTDKYFGDLLLWNKGSDFAHRVRPPLQWNLKNVADFGGGIGTLSILFAMQGRNVWHVDLPGLTRDFAEYRFKQYGMDDRITVCGSLNEIEKGTLDAITAIDVMEHIHDDDVYDVVESMARALKPEGRFYHRSSFGDDPQHPMHIGHPEVLANALAKYGFREHDPHTFIKEGDV